MLFFAFLNSKWVILSSFTRLPFPVQVNVVLQNSRAFGMAPSLWTNKLAPTDTHLLILLAKSFLMFTLLVSKSITSEGILLRYPTWRYG